MADARYAGIDIGGTKIYCLITDEKGKIYGKGRKKTKGEKGFKAVMDRVTQVVEEACADAGIAVGDLTAAGAGAPSPILPDGTAVFTPNLCWRNEPLAKTLKKKLGVPVFAENDCNAGTLGESALGAGKGAKLLVGLFVGTGLGGGVIYKNEVMPGVNYLAAEIGHMIVEHKGRACGCGHNGCLEAYTSKTGMGVRFGYEIAYRGRKSKLEELCEGKYNNIKSSILSKAYTEGDEVTVETLHEAADYLGLGIANLITLLGPDMIVVGGGVYEALGKKLLPRVKAAAEKYTFPAASFKGTKIALASLGDDAVALGAMVHALNGLRAGKE